MNDLKKNDKIDQFRRTSVTPLTNRNRDSRSKWNPLKDRHICLTDTPTDQTKSSNENRDPQIQRLQLVIRRLQRENSELKETVLKMKASDFYGINEEKVKNLIRQNQCYKQQIRVLRQEIQKGLIQKDFLERNNRNLKTQYQEFAKENNRSGINSRLKTQQSRVNYYELKKETDLNLKQSKVIAQEKQSTSNDRSRNISKSTKRKTLLQPFREQKNPDCKKKQQLTNSSQKVNEDYFSRQGKNSSRAANYR